MQLLQTGSQSSNLQYIFLCFNIFGNDLLQRMHIQNIFFQNIAQKVARKFRVKEQEEGCLEGRLKRTDYEEGWSLNLTGFKLHWSCEIFADN